MLPRDEVGTERDHEEDAEHPAEEGDHADLQQVDDDGGVGPLPDEQRGKREDHAGRHRLPGRSHRLNHVGLEDGTPVEQTECGNRHDGRWNRGADREPHAEAQVGVGRAEHHRQHDADEHRLEGELRHVGLGRHVRRILFSGDDLVGLGREALPNGVGRRRGGHGFLASVVRESGKVDSCRRRCQAEPGRPGGSRSPSAVAPRTEGSGPPIPPSVRGPKAS